MMQIKKQKVTLTQLQRYLPFPCPEGKSTLPDRIRRFLLSPSFGNLPFKDQNTIKDKYDICYRNYYPTQVIVNHLDKLTKEKYYRHSLQMAVRNAAQKYNLIDWYKFYKTVKLNNLQNISKRQINTIADNHPPLPKEEQQRQKAAKLIQRVYCEFKYRQRVKKGRAQVSEIKRTIEQRLVIELGKQSVKMVKDFYLSKNGSLSPIVESFQKELDRQKVTFIQLDRLLNDMFQMYIQQKKVIYLYLHFDPVNKGYFTFSNFKQVIFEIKKERKFVAQTEYLSSTDQVMSNIQIDMKTAFYSVFDMLNEFIHLYLHLSNHPNKDDQLEFQPFYNFISDKGQHKYSKYQISKVLERIKFYQNLVYLFNPPKKDQLVKAVVKMTEKKQRKKQLHSENQVFYSYKKILFYIVGRCKAQKLTKQAFSQFIVSQDPSLKYNSFFSVFRVYGNMINIKRIKSQSQLNSFACLLRTLNSDSQYEKLYDEFADCYHDTFQWPYTNILDKLNLRLDFLLQNNNLQPLPQINPHDIVNYRKTIKLLFQPDMDLIARTYIHRKVASKIISLYRRVQYNKNLARVNAMNIMGKTLVDEQKKSSKKKDTIESNDSKSKRGTRRMLTEKSVAVSCKSNKKSQIFQKKHRPQDIQLMKDILFEMVDKFIEDKNDSIKKRLNSINDRKQDYVKKFKVVAVKKDKITFRSSLINCFAYHQLIGLVIYGNNNELMCFRNHRLDKIQIKLLYKPNISVLGLEIFENFIVILTSYFTLEFYKLHQPSKYPFKTLKVGENVLQKLGNNEIQKLAKDGQFGAYPRLLKCLSGQILGLNMSFIDGNIWIMKRGTHSQESQEVIFPIKICKREHYFNQSIQKLIRIMDKRLQKKSIEEKIRLINEVVDFLSTLKEEVILEQTSTDKNGKTLDIFSKIGEKIEGLKSENQTELQKDKLPSQDVKLAESPQQSQSSPPFTLNFFNIQTTQQNPPQKKDFLTIASLNYKKFLQVIQTTEQNQEGRRSLSQYHWIEIFKFFMFQTQKQFFRVELREQLIENAKFHFKIKVPQQIRQVTLIIQEHLMQINFSLKDLILKLDEQKQGCIKVKKIKDYFLKITQQSYLIHEKRIDSYLKKLSISKHISYDSFVSIFTEWNFKIWQKPRQVVRDFFVVEKFSLLIYTLDSDCRIFIRTLSVESRIIAILEGHQSVPSITFADDQMILISGDSCKIQFSTINMHLWRLNEDVILKLCSDKVLKVKPFYTKKSVHDDGISSISYLPRSHCLVTSSIDSTMKIHLINSNPFNLQQTERIYYHECYFLSLMTKSFEIQKDIVIESLVSLRIKKHINQKNVNKYEVTCEVFDVEKVTAKVPTKNQFINLPIKLISMMQNHAFACLKKKEKHQAKKVQKQMQAFISTDFLQQSLDENFFSALKSYFIFNEPNRLINLLKYIQKKQDSHAIMESILLKYGLKIVDNNLFRINVSEKSMMKNYELTENEDQNLSQIEKDIRKGNTKITVFQQDFNQIKAALQKLSNKGTGSISTQKLLEIAEIFLFDKQLQKFNFIVQYESKRVKSLIEEKQKLNEKMNNFSPLKSNSKLMNSSLISANEQNGSVTQLNPKDILKYFTVKEVKNNVQRLYKYLREMAMLLKNKKTPIWRLFTKLQQNVPKQRFIFVNNFVNELKNAGFQEDKAQLISWYLAENGKISIIQLINYVEIAFKEQQSCLKQNQKMNFSQLFHSNVIESESRYLENVDQYNNSKLKQSIQQKSKVNSIIRTSGRLHKTTKFENNDSEINQRKSENSSNKSSRKQSPKAASKVLRSLPKSQSISRCLSPSNSLGTLTREMSYSHTKDSKKRQISQIRHKLTNLLSNQKKTLWQLASSAIPQFLQQSIITQTEYFDLFKLMKSSLKLSEKLTLLNYLKDQHPQRVINLNDLFQLLQDSNHVYVRGQKYIIQYFVNKLLSSDQNLTIEQTLQLYFFSQSEDELTLQQFIQRCCHLPFKFNQFALRQFQQLLSRQSKSGFVKEDIIDLIDKICEKYQLKIESRNLTIMEEILFKIDKRKVLFQDIFHKVDVVNQNYFVSCINNLSKNYPKKAILKDFQSIKLNYKKTLRKKTQNPTTSNTKRTSKSTVSKILQIPYAKFKTQLCNILEDTRELADKQRQSGRKLVRYLQSKRISVFNFFISLDLQKKFFINEIQFETGLTQIGIEHSFWHAINKKFENRLYYYEFVRYLVDSNVLDIKYVDSELEIAMGKLIKKVMRSADLEEFYQKLVDHDVNAEVKQVTFKSFNHFFVQNYSIFSQKEISFLFSTFVNSEHIKNSKFSNDEIIKNEENIEKTFNFQNFVDVVHLFKVQTLTKTPQFKFMDYLKKRNISLFHEFYKFMEKNKKNKEISQALKKKSTILSKQLILTFLNEIKAGLSEKEIKDMLSSYTQAHIDFTVINQKLEQVYRKSSSFINREEAEVYLGDIIKKSKEQNVAIQRLFSDFCQNNNNKLTLKDFMNMSDFLNTGLNKIQLKKVFTILLDEQNKGFCFMSQMMNAIENVEEKIDKEEQDFQFDFILEKIETHRKDISLRETQIAISLQRCIMVFEKVLTKDESIQLYIKVGENLKKQKQLSEKDINTFIDQKINEKRMKADKKYKELVLTLLNTINKCNIDITEVYKYFTMGSKNIEVLAKDRFLLLYQSVILKSNIIDVNNLYSYFDENKTGNISLQKWEQKLGIVDMQNENVHGSVEELKVFYKVKLFLSELYLTFIQKQFKTSQIYHYFDKHATGYLKYSQFWLLIYQLGFDPSDEIQRKVVNYLDRTKSKIIEIRVLMNELQNTLGKKQKIIYQTKTSFIFKKSSNIIQPKYSYFITELIKHQQLIQRVFQDNQIKQQSCIMQSDFLSILKRFGIYLTQEQQSDLRINFHVRQNYLYLYPIYFMLKNIFEQTSTFEQKQNSQKLLFKKLLCQMIRKKITLRQMQMIKGHEEMRSFMKQLKIFTPIEIDILIDNISYDESSIINPQKLKVKIRDSYVDHPLIYNENLILVKSPTYGENKLNNNTEQYQYSLNNVITEDDYLNQILRDHLRSLLKFHNHIPLLENYSKNIYQLDFKDILLKLGCRVKVKDMKKYFKAFAQGKKFIKAENLIFQNTFKNTKNHHQNQHSTNHDINLLIEHIQKSLHYTNKKLKKALEKYFIDNYGFVSVQNFKRFLNQIGYEDKQKENEVVNKFISFYEKNYLQIENGKKCKQLQLVKLQDILSTQEDQDENSIEQNQWYAVQTQTKAQSILSPEIKRIIIDLKVNNGNLIEFLKKQDTLQSFSVEILYKFITQQLTPSEFTLRQKFSYQKAARLFCSQLNRTHITIDEIETKINYLIKFHYMHSQTESNQTASKIENKHSNNTILEKVIKTNIIQIFIYQVNCFVENVSRINIAEENIDRLTLNLLFQHIQGSRHLLKIDSRFQRFYSRDTTQKIQIISNFSDIKIQLVTNSDLVIETENYLEEKALTVINQKYYAIPINKRNQFEPFAKIACHLNPSCKFIRAKGYFLWEPNKDILPKCSIRYRWKFIRNFTSNLLHKFAKIHKLGYCCPHLRYEDLNQSINTVIDKAIYPWKIDPSGKIIQTLHSELFEIYSAYSVPEIVRNQKSLITSKCDTWIFGCLLYEFIWGHEPQSFFNELLKFHKARHVGEEITEILEIAQYPVEFAFKFYNTQKILKVYEQQFYFDNSNTHRDLQTSIKKWQSFKGLIYPLQVVFGKDLPFYQDEFNTMIQIHQIISECLDPNPITRPSIEEILKRPLFERIDNFNLKPYIETVKRHIDTSKLQNDIFVEFDEVSKEIELEGQCVEMLQRIIDRVYEFVGEAQNIQSKIQLVDKIFTIPKNFPWPVQNSTTLSQQHHPYSYNLFKNKDIILQNPLFNTICKIFKKKMIPKTIEIFKRVSDYVSKDTRQLQESKTNELRQLEKCQLKLQNLLFNVLELTKNYLSPACGFVENVIEYVLEYISENPRLNLKIEQKVRDFSVMAQQSVHLAVQQDPAQFSPSEYFKLPTINPQKLTFIKKLQNIIFINGQGNAQYTVLSDYLSQHQMPRTIIEVFYSSMDLMTLTNKCDLSINYFRDRIYLIEEMPNLMRQLRVELLVMRNINEKSLKENCLRYFVELVGNNNEMLPKLFYCQLFYMNLITMLRNPLETLDVKNNIIEIIIKLLQRDQLQIIQTITSPSCNMLPFIIRLLIEPQPELALHQQFELLQEKLGQLVHVIESSFTLRELFQEIEGGLYALKHFKRQDFMDKSFKPIN